MEYRRNNNDFNPNFNYDTYLEKKTMHLKITGTECFKRLLTIFVFTTRCSGFLFSNKHVYKKKIMLIIVKKVINVPTKRLYVNTRDAFCTKPSRF